MARSPRPIRSKAKREFDRAEIARLHLQGQTQEQIAQAVGLSRPTIAREIKILIELWRERALADTTAVRGQELAKLDQLAAQAWAGWHRSQQERTGRVVEESGRQGTNRRARIETYSQNGDAQFLQTLLRVAERRAKLLGLDPPQKTAITDGEGQSVGVLVFPQEIEDVDEWVRQYSTTTSH